MNAESSQLDIAALAQAAEQAPLEPERWLALGAKLRGAGKLEAAANALVRAVSLEPESAAASYQLALTLQKLGDLAAATLCFERAADLAPEHAALQRDFAALLDQKGESERAIGHYHCALALGDGSLELLLELGGLLRRIGRREGALGVYRRALALAPDNAELHNDVGNLLCDLRQVDAAIASYRRALLLDPQLGIAHANLGAALKSAGLMEEAVRAFRQALDLDAGDAVTRSNLLFSLAYHGEITPDVMLEEAQRFGRQHVEPLRALRLPHANDRKPNRRLRIGYVSSDFRDHVATLFVLPVLEKHDRSAYEIFAYSNVRDRDAWTERFRSKVKHFCDIFPLDDSAAAEQIRRDGIDVLVDLTMHSSNPRQLLFARCPAPVQLCWFAYPGTTGNDGIGYRLTDPHLDPPESEPGAYTERSVRLPHTFWCYDPQSSGPALSALPALANGFVTFGCLNNFCKVGARNIELWARVLREVKGSKMILLAPQGEAQARARAAFERAGVEAAALQLVDRMPRQNYLAMFGRIDLALDTLPYNGHTTSLDAAWMGVPTVTLAGDTVAGRAGVTLAMNLGLPALVTRSADDFVRRSLELAGDWGALSELRRGLRARLQGSPLMDMRAFVRDLEAAYRALWREWCEARVGPNAE